MMNLRRYRPGVIWLGLLVALSLVWFAFARSGCNTSPTTISQVVNDAKQAKIAKITQVENSRKITVEYKDTHRTNGVSRLPQDTNIFDLLTSAGVDPSTISIEIKEASRWGNVFSILTFILPTLLLIGIFVFFMRQSQGSNNQAMSFGKSRARLFTANRPSVTFSDVAGVEEAKEELVEVVEFLKYPEKFAALGARIPRGVLLVGPPGTGKTLLSRAVAGEAGVPFFSISGSEFVEMFVGVGASRVRDLFDQAKRNAPCIVFIDEIDAVGRQRGAGLGGSHDEREQTLNQILVEMDGFDTGTNVIVLASTNRPDVLDPALLRPGRFDRQVVLDRPDIKGRKAILEVHVRGKPLDKNVELLRIAQISPGFSGADLANVVNEAAILAARRNKKTIGQIDFEEALEKVALGSERRSRVITEKEKWIVAYH